MHYLNSCLIEMSVKVGTKVAHKDVTAAALIVDLFKIWGKMATYIYYRKEKDWLNDILVNIGSV
jgi:hypothetical protein